MRESNRRCRSTQPHALSSFRTNKIFETFAMVCATPLRTNTLRGAATRHDGGKRRRFSERAGKHTTLSLSLSLSLFRDATQTLFFIKRGEFLRFPTLQIRKESIENNKIEFVMYLYYSCFDVRAIDTSNVYVLVLLKADTYQSSYVSLESLNPTKSLNTTLLFFFF